MKFFLVITVILLYACTEKRSATDNPLKTQLRVIRIKGSETIRPFIERAISNYEERHPEVIIDYSGGGSNLGLLALKQNEADIIFASRSFNEDELGDMPANKNLIKDLIAYDALCVIVSIRNNVNELTRGQLSDIYAGKVSNWKEVGGKDMPIQVYSRDISSGSYSFFKDRILLNDNYSSSDINLVHNEEIVSNVRDKLNAIGYVGLGNINEGIKAVRIKKEGESEFISPSFANIKSNNYLLSRELNVLYFLESDTVVKNFIAFLQGPECAEIITEVGFLNK